MLPLGAARWKAPGVTHLVRDWVPSHQPAAFEGPPGVDPERASVDGAVRLRQLDLNLISDTNHRIARIADHLFVMTVSAVGVSSSTQLETSDRFVTSPVNVMAVPSAQVASVGRANRGKLSTEDGERTDSANAKSLET